MCGIIGLVSKSKYGFHKVHQDIFTNLLVTDSIRGPDSTGVFGVTREGNVDFIKDKGDPFSFFSNKEATKFVDDMFTHYNMVVGHNRKATFGTITDENAHPFAEGSTVLVHNGTLQNHKKLTDEKVEVDSHAIVHSMEKEGIKKTLNDIEGAFALAWYNVDDKRLYLSRNIQRPLWVAEADNFFAFGSEPGMLHWIISRENIKIKEIKEVETKKLYFFDVDDPTKLQEEELKPEPTESVIKSFFRRSPKREETNKETKETPKNTPTQISKGINHVFKQDELITMVVKHVRMYKEPQLLDGFGDKEFVGFAITTWVVDPTLRGMVYLTKEDVADLSDMEGDLIDVIVKQAKYDPDNSKRTRFIYGADPIEHTQIKDAVGNDVYLDDFSLISKPRCSKCNTQVSWENITKMRYIPKKPNQNQVITCPTCFKGELH